MRTHIKARPEMLRGAWPFCLAIFFALLPFGAGPQGATEGSALRQFVLVILFLAAAFAVLRFPERLAMLRAGVPVSMLLLLVYVALSASWSPDPWVSFKRVVQVLGVTVLGLGVLIGGNGSYRVHRLAPPVLWVGMMLAIIYSAAFFDAAFVDNGLRAFMATKNNFGQFAVLCTLLPVLLLRLEPNARRWIWIPLALCGAIALVLSRSATSAVALGAVALMFVMMSGFRQIGASWKPVLLGLGMVLLVGLFGAGVWYGFPSVENIANTILAPTGRDLTLTGRTYLWDLMTKEGLKHPWFGIGYGGFWLGLEGLSGQVAYQVKWGYPGQAHNGYIDLFNELGLIGCLFVLGLVFEHTRNVVKLYESDPKLGMYHASILVLVLVLNMAEATFLRTTHVWWMLFVASVIETSAQVHWRSTKVEGVTKLSKQQEVFA